MGQFALCGDTEVFDNLVPQSPTQEAHPEPEGPVSLRENEIEQVKRALAKTGFNQRRAAAMLGLSYSAFRRRMVKFGLRESLP
jgi:transcriptional regulator with GAF, ATPase, and Fis domain